MDKRLSTNGNKMDRRYHHLQQWTPVIIINYVVETRNRLTWKRHIDQLRERSEGSSEPKEGAEVKDTQHSASVDNFEILSSGNFESVNTPTPTVNEPEGNESDRRYTQRTRNKPDRLM